MNLFSVFFVVRIYKELLYHSRDFLVACVVGMQSVDSPGVAVYFVFGINAADCI